MQENKVSKRCKEQGCGTLASYNFPGERSMAFCKKHALPGMVSHSQTVRLAQASCKVLPPLTRADWRASGFVLMGCVLSQLRGVSAAHNDTPCWACRKGSK